MIPEVIIFSSNSLINDPTFWFIDSLASNLFFSLPLFKIKSDFHIKVSVQTCVITKVMINDGVTETCQWFRWKLKVIFSSCQTCFGLLALPDFILFGIFLMLIFLHCRFNRWLKSLKLRKLSSFLFYLRWRDDRSNHKRTIKSSAVKILLQYTSTKNQMSLSKCT